MTKSPYDILVIDDDKNVIDHLEASLKKNEWSYLVARNSTLALEMLEEYEFKLVIAELSTSGISGLELLEWLATRPHKPEVIIITSEATIESAIKALKLGAFDYLTKPLSENERVLYCVRHAIEKYELTNKMKEVALGYDDGGLGDIIGRSPKMQVVYELVQNISKSEANVLVTGESGTGKELVAKAIHNLSHRKNKPFVVINCAAMPETLLESELFGFKRGAFTGANEDKIGLFEAAMGGTVFLDEIGEISLATQVKLLRVIQEGEVRRVGSNDSIQVDVRIIAATNQNLSDMVDKGTFREDLYYRLNVILIQLPSLRERSEDIYILAYHFLKSFAEKMNKSVTKISVDALQAMQNYNWPGNVRELENVIERAVVLAESDTVTAKKLPPKILSQSFYTPASSDEDITQLNYKEAKKRALNIFNRSYIIGLLEKTGGNITQASDYAGMDRSNFKKIIRKYKIDAKYLQR